jgi:hypothetical protein
MYSAPVPASKMIVRTTKENSAFLYNLLEAHEGLTAYSTLEFKQADPYRDVELMIPPGSEAAVKKLIQDLESFVIILSIDGVAVAEPIK